MKTAEIRSSFLEHFEQREHRLVPSAPLIPLNDPSLLFTVAGMVQFKEALTGRETLPYTRAATCQRCVRAGGKHNDLENVGFTARHHTFFEMLGNFSFGDYFKEEAITWGWEFFHDVLALDKEQIWITVHPSDDEARSIWSKHIGIREDRIVDHEENFWTMGDTGPCGPCSEIFFDQGASVPGGPPGSKDEDGDRFLEIGNLVFPQFDRSADGSLDPLASPGVDTGMGLERIAGVLQHVPSNFETDVFRPIFTSLKDIGGFKSIEDALQKPSCRVIADHIRCASFLIGDGVLPDRDGRGYVLRRIIRRALRHAKQLGIEQLFFSQLVEPLVEEMGDAYPQLVEHQERIEKSLNQEESRFKETLDRGLELLESEFKTLTSNTLSGEVAFKLYDTYGFPLDLTMDIAKERDIQVDEKQFDVLMSQQQERARQQGQFNLGLVDSIDVSSQVEFTGYTELEGTGRVISLYATDDGKRLTDQSELSTGQSGFVVLSESAFYGEAGGQIGDKGVLTTKDARFEVSNATRINEQFLHHGEVSKGVLKLGDEVRYKVDQEHRQDVARNHSATHLLHAALRLVLGDHVQQRGSLVANSHLRFDFSHDKAMSIEEIREVEMLVNEEIHQNTSVNTELLSYDAAIESGAMALFGEKYDDTVRVLTMGGGLSIELCGGTHVSHLGEIGLFTIKSESSIAAGIRRVEAITGREAYRDHVNRTRLIQDLTKLVSSTPGQLLDRVEQINKERLELKSSVVSSVSLKDSVQKLESQAEEIGDLMLLTSHVDVSPEVLMSCYDLLKQKWPKHVLVLSTNHKARTHLVCGVGKALTERFTANDVIKILSKSANIRGGGKPTMARAGGQATEEELKDAFEALNKWLRTQKT